jgi:asparagine synthetase B (glutamine-hydrolysing)
MNQGVEMRFPFLNKNLKDLLYVTPLKYKVDKSLIQKNLLRKVASKIIPDHLMFEKLSFGTPGTSTEHFKKSQRKFKEPAFKNIFNSNFKYMKKIILYGLHSKLKFFKKDFLKELIRKQENSKNCKFDVTLWRIWSFATWYESKFKNKPS